MLQSEIPLIFPFIVFFIFLFFAFFKLGIYLWNLDYKNRRELTAYHLKDKKSLSEILNIISPPFTLEIFCRYLGKSVDVHIKAPASVENKLNSLGAKKVSDYSICGPEGSHFGAYFLPRKKDIKISDIDINCFDFSKVNEFGESAIVQIIFDNKKDKKLSMNIRVLVSSPSSFQSKEIISAIKKSIPIFKSTDVKGGNFIDDVCYHNFVENKKFILSV